MYRLVTRLQGSRREPTNRILTYIETGNPGAAGGSFQGVNATIIDGQLYIMSKNKKLKFYGFSRQFPGTSQHAGRTVLCRQPMDNNDKTSPSTTLTSCTINRSQGAVIMCKPTGSQPVALWELAWLGRRP